MNCGNNKFTAFTSLHICSNISNSCVLRELKCRPSYGENFKKYFKFRFTQLAKNRNHVICENSEIAEAKCGPKRAAGTPTLGKSKCTYINYPHQAHVQSVFPISQSPKSVISRKEEDIRRRKTTSKCLKNTIQVSRQEQKLNSSVRIRFTKMLYLLTEEVTESPSWVND